MRRLLLVSMVAGVVLSALLLAVPARAAPGTSVVVSLDANRVALGAAFDARVVIQADVATTGAQCALSFNPAVLECTGVSAGDFYPSGSLMIPDPSAIDIDNVGGTVEMAATVAFAPVSAKSGSLFVYHFTAKAEGTSTLHLSDVIVMDDRFGELLGVTVNDGNLVQRPFWCKVCNEFI